MISILFLALHVTSLTAFWPWDPHVYPFPYPNGITPCNDRENPPPILSFHVHLVFYGTNRTKSAFALKVRHKFIDYIQNIDPSFVEMCPFSHTNAAAYYRKICVFPPHWNATMDSFPFPMTDPLFTTTNDAFFIPKEYLLMAEEWWRQHNDPALASYMVHVNTGCEDNSHTFWAMTNEGYPFYTNHSGIVCWQSGPPGCFCDFIFYTVSGDGTDGCLTANYEDNTVSVEQCNVDDKPPMSTWSETYYNETFIQIENMGQTDVRKKMCLGQDYSDRNMICEKGTKLALVPCHERDHRLNLFNWINGTVKALHCGSEANLCLNYQVEDKQLVLDDCSKASVVKRIPFTHGNVNASAPF